MVVPAGRSNISGAADHATIRPVYLSSTTLATTCPFCLGLCFRVPVDIYRYDPLLPAILLASITPASLPVRCVSGIVIKADHGLIPVSTFGENIDPSDILVRSLLAVAMCSTDKSRKTVNSYSMPSRWMSHA